MQQPGFFWATLNPEQLNMLQEAERTLGRETDLLLAFQPAGMDMGELGVPESRIRVAKLSESQVECLQGLEQKIDAVVIAYQNPG